VNNKIIEEEEVDDQTKMMQHIEETYQKFRVSRYQIYGGNLINPYYRDKAGKQRPPKL
jgi:hypothetical protein